MTREEEHDDAPPSGRRRATTSTWDGAGSRAAAALKASMPTERVSLWPFGQCALEVGEALVDEGGNCGGTYRVVRLIGRGGMGEVYEVEREGTGERFALKCMRMGRADDPKVVRRTQEEAIVLQSLRHPHLVPVYAMGLRSDGLVWMVMQLLVGWTAGQLLDSLGRLPAPWALTIARDVCLGLQAVHPFAVHRDIKPDNIHVDEQGHVRVLDLGAGKFQRLGAITTGGFSIGTVAYMSPEQIMTPDAVDARSDLFSTGVVLYELLSGQHPFASREDMGHKNKIGLAIAHDAPRPLVSVAPWVPAAVGEIVAQALEKDPADRQENAEQLAVALDAALRRMEHEMGELPPLRTIGTRVPLPEAYQLPPEEKAARDEAAACGEAEGRGRGGTERLSAPRGRGRGSTERMPLRPPAPTESVPPRGRGQGHTERMPSIPPRAADQAAPAAERETEPGAPEGGRGAGGRRAGDRAWRPRPPAMRDMSRMPELDTREIVAEFWARHAETEPVPRAAVAAARKEADGEETGFEAEPGLEAEADDAAGRRPGFAGWLARLPEKPPWWVWALFAVWMLGWLGASAYVYLTRRAPADADKPAAEVPAVTTAENAASAAAPATAAPPSATTAAPPQGAAPTGAAPPPKQRRAPVRPPPPKPIFD
ncbi:serine/threonine protein kinase [Sorangium sp. So ce1128]